jgi:hypothetical protein
LHLNDHAKLCVRNEYQLILRIHLHLSLVLDEEAGLAQRGTFIIDPDGVVQAAEINADGIGRLSLILVVMIQNLLPI